MPRPSGKTIISLKGNSKNLPDIYFRELVQLYSRDCRIRGIEEVTIAGYEYACKKFLEYLQEDIRLPLKRRSLSRRSAAFAAPIKRKSYKRKCFFVTA